MPKKSLEQELGYGADLQCFLEFDCESCMEEMKFFIHVENFCQNATNVLIFTSQLKERGHWYLAKHASSIQLSREIRVPGTSSISIK